MQEKGKKKAFNSGSAALVSALAALSKPARQRVTFWWGTIFSFLGHLQLVSARRVLLKSAESLNVKPLKCRVTSCSGRSDGRAQGGASRWRVKCLWDGGVARRPSLRGEGGWCKARRG